MMRPPAVGDSLDGHIRLVRLLGEGGMASVFEAHHDRLGTRVAVKVLAQAFARDAELVARFEREARAVAKLSTRHVAHVIEVGTARASEAPYIVMEFLDGRDLEAELVDRGALPVAEVVDYAIQTCAGVHDAHERGIVHRDLKPANLFLANEAGERVVKVLDFGISKVIGEPTKLTAPSAVMGTVLYMAPEQIRAARDVDARSDIWSLGVILYELLAGRPPWEGSSAEIASSILSVEPPPLDQVAAVPPAVAQLVRAMIHKDPARRPQSMRDVVFALAPFAPKGSVGAATAENVVAASLPQPAPTRTVRLVSSPSVAPTPRPSHVPLPAPPAPTAVAAPIPTPPIVPEPRAAAPAPRQGSTWLLFALFGVLGACGLVLVVLASLRGPKPSRTGTTVIVPSAAPLR